MLYKLLEVLLCCFQNTLHMFLPTVLLKKLSPFFLLRIVYNVYLDDGKL